MDPFEDWCPARAELAVISGELERQASTAFLQSLCLARPLRGLHVAGAVNVVHQNVLFLSPFWALG